MPATLTDIAEEMAPTLPLSRHIFATPTYYYKTGIAFLAWLNGHQDGFVMVGGLQSARSILHLARVFELANEAQLLTDPDLAAHRLGQLFAAAGVDPVTSRPELSRLSLNQRTTASWSLPEAIKGCVDAGLGAIGIWREQLAEVGLDEACRLVAESGLRVSSLCRGGFFTTADPAEAAAAEAANREAIEEAAALNAATLVLVAGGLPPGDK